jgi:hypothetical protein
MQETQQAPGQRLPKVATRPPLHARIARHVGPALIVIGVILLMGLLEGIKF